MEMNPVVMAAKHIDTSGSFKGRNSRWAAIAINLVIWVPAPLKSIADQVIQSASSVPANIAEGHGRFGRDRSNIAERGVLQDAPL